MHTPEDQFNALFGERRGGVAEAEPTGPWWHHLDEEMRKWLTWVSEDGYQTLELGGRWLPEYDTELRELKATREPVWRTVNGMRRRLRAQTRITAITERQARVLLRAWPRELQTRDSTVGAAGLLV